MLINNLAKLSFFSAVFAHAGWSIRTFASAVALFSTQTTFTSKFAWNGWVRAIGLHMAVE